MHPSTPGHRPVVLVVADDPETTAALATSVGRRFGGDYAVLDAPGPGAALLRLQALHDTNADVALIAASHRMTEVLGTTFLGRTRDLFPRARRVVLASFLDLAAMPEIARASMLGEIDAYERLPWIDPDEAFLASIGAILADWAREQPPASAPVTIVGRHDDPQSQLLSDVLQRWGVPLTFLEAESEAGRALVAEAGPNARIPTVRLAGQPPIAGASIASVVEKLGFDGQASSETFDVTVIGLGPAGFSASLNAASEGFRTMMIEPAFSQASSSPMIRNYLGFPAGVSGGELLRRAWYQTTLFGAKGRVGRSARAIRAAGDLIEVELDDGSTVPTRSAILSMGVAYRRLDVPSVDGLVGRGVFYTYGPLEAQALAGRPAAVVGGANSAVQAAIHLAKYASTVRLIVRGPDLASSASEYLLEQLGGLPTIEVLLNSEVVSASDRQQLRSLTVRNRRDGTTSEIETAGAFILIGSVPRTDWLPPEIARDEHGFVLTGDGPDGLSLETTMRGVFAAGDVRAGSVKRVAAAVGEGAEAVQQLHRFHAARGEGQPAAR
jgi:thioredoxin reductase (NADPH)